jgi:outer membrane immunogenic protein
MMPLSIGLAFAATWRAGLPLLMGVTTMRKYSLTLLAAAAVALAASQTASAADLGPVRRAPPPAPAYVPPPVFSWTGFYIGGNLGVAWTEASVCCDDFGNSRHNSQQAVFTGGGQVGANYQWNWLVVGVEGDFDWLANNHNSSNTVVLGNNAFQLSANDRWIATVTGRVGYAFNLFGANGWGWNPGTGGPWLIYGKGGWGWAGVNNITLTNVTTGGSIDFSNSNSNDGPVGGVGVEWAFAPNWTVKLEYDRLFLNSKNFTVPAGFDAIGGRNISIFNRDVQTVTVGINYLFNWGHY